MKNAIEDLIFHWLSAIIGVICLVVIVVAVVAATGGRTAGCATVNGQMVQGRCYVLINERIVEVVP